MIVTVKFVVKRDFYIYLIVPKGKFTLLQGEDVLKTYKFNTGVA
jgi:hypothetical protein